MFVPIKLVSLTNHKLAKVGAIKLIRSHTNLGLGDLMNIMNSLPHVVDFPEEELYLLENFVNIERTNETSDVWKAPWERFLKGEWVRQMPQRSGLYAVRNCYDNTDWSSVQICCTDPVRLTFQPDDDIWKGEGVLWWSEPLPDLPITNKALLVEDEDNDSWK